MQTAIEYLAAYGIWGIAGPLLCIIVPAITYTVSESRTVGARVAAAGCMQIVTGYVAFLFYCLTRI